MVEGDEDVKSVSSESFGSDTHLESKPRNGRDNEFVNEMSPTRPQKGPCQKKRLQGKSRYRSQHQKRLSPTSQESYNVRDRKHPHVDPAEIDARILAMAYEQESAASSKSAPELSVYSSDSSQHSSYLDRTRRKNRVNTDFTTYDYRKGKKQNHCQSPASNLPVKAPKAHERRIRVVDPDATFVSDEEDESDDDDYDDASRTYEDEDGSRTYEDDEEDYSDEGSHSDDDHDHDHDEDSVWDEHERRHLRAYDVEDDEEDLAETPKPYYLRDCLELLRTSETDDHAYSKQKTALKHLPQLIQGKDKPADLPDLAVPLALELMRMEDKFNIEDFTDSKLISAIALATEEPLAVGQRLILLLWEDIAFADRLNVLTVLSEAAFELSGNKELEEWNKTQSKARYVCLLW